MHRFRLWLAAFLTLFFVGKAMADVSNTDNSTATFAGGCFWCMEPEFANIEGVSQVVSGYTGGAVANPTYEEISFGNTGHVEAIQITYDPAKVNYQTLLDIFWSNVDPLDPNGQFCDKGAQYRAGIFFHNKTQRKLAEASQEAMSKKLGEPVATFIREAAVFYPAEDYHQEYYIKNKIRYKMYRDGCGRDQRLEELKQSIAQ
jgi:peptide-methionine (S)-S-oxide reductase